jgi:hypothetical protein
VRWLVVVLTSFVCARPPCIDAIVALPADGACATLAP